MAVTKPRGESSDNPLPVVIFAPLPVLTVTVEDRSGEADIHVHAGGQGVWQSTARSTGWSPKTEMAVVNSIVAPGGTLGV